jgi:putative salt-induced outer membrane protein YdiY
MRTTVSRVVRKKSVTALVFITLLFVLPSLSFAQVTDTYRDKIFLKNGDRVTGTIKELDRGKLRIKTTTMDTVYVNWLDVAAIESSTYLRISKTDGSFSYGRIQHTDLSEDLVISEGGFSTEIPIREVASMKPIRVDESMWHRIEGNIGAGIDYKKASDILLVNVASDLRFRREKYEIALALNWNETQRTENQNSSRAELSGDYTRYLGDRWFWKASAGLERNQELGIDLRTIVAGSAGRYFLQTQTMRFEVNAGLAASSERRTDNTQQESIEGVIRSSFDLFQLNIPITRLTANVSVFPGITESDRIRVNSDITLRNEIFRDFYWDLTFYSTYDNQPVNGAQKEDFGIVTSLGATF